MSTDEQLFIIMGVAILAGCIYGGDLARRNGVVKAIGVAAIGISTIASMVCWAFGMGIDAIMGIACLAVMGNAVGAGLGMLGTSMIDADIWYE